LGPVALLMQALVTGIFPPFSGEAAGVLGVVDATF
jgi:hypothetical protein